MTPTFALHIRNTLCLNNRSVARSNSVVNTRKKHPLAKIFRMSPTDEPIGTGLCAPACVAAHISVSVPNASRMRPASSPPDRSKRPAHRELLVGTTPSEAPGANNCGTRLRRRDIAQRLSPAIPSSPAPTPRSRPACPLFQKSVSGSRGQFPPVPIPSQMQADE
jgi:hypothetical protein